MKETFIKVLDKVEFKNPILIEGLPGLGLVGNIATHYLIRQLKAKKFAHLYSPHFPYFVLVNEKGSVRLLRGTFHFWKNYQGNNDLLFFTGDRQAQTIEGQYEICNNILTFAKKQGVNIVVTLGGYRVEVKNKPSVLVAATNKNLLNKALNAKTIVSPIGTPIVGTAGLILGLAPFQKIDALCLLSETRGYLPDPRAAKSVLETLQKIFNFNVDLTELNKEIADAKKTVARLQKIERDRTLQAEEMQKEEDEKIKYIS